VARTFLRALLRRRGHQFVFSNLGSLVCLAAGTLVCAHSRVAEVVSANASGVEQLAAEELTSHLRVLYPSANFRTGAPASSDWAIYLGTVSELPAMPAEPIKERLAKSESFVVSAHNGAEAHSAVIASGSPSAVLFAVNAPLEKLGFGANLSYNTAQARGTSHSISMVRTR
jgi:hypothetical protein